MSGKALRDHNASPLLDRKAGSSSKGSIGKSLSGNNNENIDMQSSNNSNQDPAAAKTFSGAAKLMDAVPEVVCPEIEYLESENLNDLEDVDAHLATLLERLDSKDWVMVCEALTHVRQLSIFHKEAMLPILANEITLIVKSVKNPRSALCKTAIMASSDLFKAYQDQMIDYLDPLLLQLFLRACQDKRFVAEAAEKAVITMTMCISPNLLVHKLQPYVKHKNPRIRAKASMCISRSVQRLGLEGIRDYGLDTLLQIAASQLSDQLPEAREAARTLALELRAVYDKFVFNHEAQEVAEPMPKNDAWDQFCKSKLSASNALAVIRVTSATT
ncbi:hypothetical protein SUGI_0564420 [Cryptomeria japonica]|uniref:uncharacterized protein LOC131042057 isoform X1 n=2 Tax=Cryptomeria japonica TaxID=3369 RepID=UPI002408F012|nr:uncharacterized protein LOC131042057 isoform X1 [Cryptomeria japonica]XP_057831338.1 uncharacterized protein LOC131042057 isoform X1 [Cryptomeria japonica]XP_057831339.1 uncharacterized protein LOC131042057 isoform X1 [Cryptomeria japonica]GLJ28642.1 hypothetical protein SUGI_0564420 [Cryptomeria japonica]